MTQSITPSVPGGAAASTASIDLLTLHAGYHHTSLALRSIAAYGRRRLPEAGFSVLDWQLKADRGSQARVLDQRGADVLGLSTYIWNIDASLALARAVKRQRPSTLVVLGGPEAGPRAEQILTTEPAVDYVIDGEGEAAFRDLCLWWLHGEGRRRDIAGLVYRRAAGVVRNPRRDLPVAELPDLAEMGLATDRDLVYWETSRGCPFRCSFCGSAEDPLRQFPLPRIHADLAVLAGLRGKTVKLLDRSFHLGRDRTTELLRAFLRTPDDLRFHLELNPDRISDAAMEIFRQAPAGKFQFEIGLQSLNERVLQAINRNMDIDRSLRRLRELIGMRRHPVHLDLIAGLPGEDAVSFDAALDQTFRLYPDHLQLGILKLLPGTPLPAQARRAGYEWLPEPPYTVRSSDCMTAATLARFTRFAELLERLWNSGWLKLSLAALVAGHYQGSVSAGLQDLLRRGAGALLQRRPPGETIEQFINLVRPWLDTDPMLGECLLWDYAHRERPGRHTPDWIRRHWRLRQGRPQLELGPATSRLLAAVDGTRLAPGRYEIVIEHHRRGRPVSRRLLDGADPQPRPGGWAHDPA